MHKTYEELKSARAVISHDEVEETTPSHFLNLLYLKQILAIFFYFDSVIQAWFNSEYCIL